MNIQVPKLIWQTWKSNFTKEKKINNKEKILCSEHKAGNDEI